MQSEKYRQLVDRLIAKTARNELDWKEGVSPNSFQVSFPNYSLLLKEEPSVEDFSVPPPDTSLSIVDTSGNVVDKVYNFEIDDGPGERYYVKLRLLYRTVRQQVLGADKAVEEILSELGE